MQPLIHCPLSLATQGQMPCSPKALVTQGQLITPVGVPVRQDTFVKPGGYFVDEFEKSDHAGNNLAILMYFTSGLP